MSSSSMNGKCLSVDRLWVGGVESSGGGGNEVKLLYYEDNGPTDPYKFTIPASGLSGTTESLDVSFLIPYFVGGVVTTEDTSYWISNLSFIFIMTNENSNQIFPISGTLYVSIGFPLPPNDTQPYIYTTVQTINLAEIYNLQQISLNNPTFPINTTTFIRPLSIAYAVGIPTLSSLTLNVSWTDITFADPVPTESVTLSLLGIVANKPSSTSASLIPPPPPNLSTPVRVVEK